MEYLNILLRIQIQKADNVKTVTCTKTLSSTSEVHKNHSMHSFRIDLIRNIIALGPKNENFEKHLQVFKQSTSVSNFKIFC